MNTPKGQVPEALRLADAIDPFTRKTLDNLTCGLAAAKLRHLHAQVAALSAQPAPGVESNMTGGTVYACARSCADCGHSGINDGHATDAACNTCGWSGVSPKEDHCPGCNRDGTMTEACPECSGVYALVAETTIGVADRTSTASHGQAPAGAAQQAPAGATDREEMDAVIACLGDDAAALREQNPECEMAANMDRAAELLAATVAQQVVGGDATFPMQPLHIADHGVIRFRMNRIVRDALAVSHDKGCFGMNEIACGDYTPEERMQFAQLIGYSVSGYGELRYSSRKSVEKADELAEALAARVAQKEE